MPGCDGESFVLIISIGLILALLWTWRGGDFGAAEAGGGGDGGVTRALLDTWSSGFEPNGFGAQIGLIGLITGVTVWFFKSKGN